VNVCGPASDEHPDDPGRLIMQVMNFVFPPPDPGLRMIAEEPALFAAANALARCTDLQVFSQQALLKQPGIANATPWHQDDFYWETARLGISAVTAWTPLLPASAGNGTMWLLPGSHRRGLLAHAPANGVSKFQAITAPFDHAKLVPLELEPGDVSFHHPRTVHGAPDNIGTRRRVGFAQHYRQPVPR
jgi:ectoine hydroxylase-related dioxygenase (phytanoyl-CoA dioxygenase family)